MDARIVELLAELRRIVADLESACQELSEQAMRDDLTGLFNRRYLTGRMREELSRADRRGSEFAVLMLDLDGFKAWNDRYGHPAGDRVLAELAGLLRDAQRAMDVFVRYGGEEFVGLLPDTGHAGAAAAAERLRRSAQEHRFVDGTAHLTISIGVAVYPANGATDEELLRAADRALYRAKTLGKNRVCMAGSGEDAPPTVGGASSAAPGAAPSDGAPSLIPVVVGFPVYGSEPRSFWLGEEVLPILEVVRREELDGGDLRYTVSTPRGVEVLRRRGRQWLLERAARPGAP